MGVITIVGKAFLIFFAFVITSIIWGLYITPLIKYSFYVTYNQTVSAIWSEVYPESIKGIYRYIAFFVEFVDAVPYFLLIMGGILAGFYLYKQMTILRYQYGE